MNLATEIIVMIIITRSTGVDGEQNRMRMFG